MNTQIVKTYDLKQIAEFIPNYKFCKIEDLNGRVLISWNQPKKKINEHWKDCLKRMNSAPVPEGFYNIFLCNSLKSLKHADTFIIKKGDPQPEAEQTLKENMFNIPNSKNDLISVSQALNYITEIANLKVTVQTQEAEIKRLKDEITVLEAELAEEEREDLSENTPAPGQNIVEYLKESAPAILGLADRFFAQNDKKLELEKLKIEKGFYNKQPVKRNFKTIKFETGSPEHLKYIETLNDNGNEDLLNKELDKLEIFSPEKYQEICNKLGIQTEGEQNEN